LREGVFEILFWVSAGLIVYVNVGYPLLLLLLSRLFPQKVTSIETLWPRITLIISAYNERDVIREKIENALSIDYPRDRFEIVIVSDSSDDGTDDIVRRFAPDGVRLVRQEERRGKSAGLNLAVPIASGQILIFSDANAIYQPDAVRLLVRHFFDPRVGYVVGNASYSERAGQPSSAESEGLYWKLETWLKRKESQFGSVVGGDGAMYAIRRELFAPLLQTDINDFLNPLQIIARGFRGVYEPAAICFEEAGDSFEKEFYRKTRIISRSINAIRRAPSVLLPWVQPRHWFALISHKVLRWFVPALLLISLLSAAMLMNLAFYRWTLYLQLSFYALAAIGWGLEKLGKSLKIFYLPYYYCLVNAASLIGISKFLFGSLPPTWQTIRQSSPPAQDAGVHLSRKES
jgi:cellulose synthase/poly-beta-1,6-N-acetylglucosamine synthase-like glycosyltransferase